MNDGDQGDTESNPRGAQASTNPFDETTPLIPPTATPPPYQATETGDARLPARGHGNESGERRAAPPPYAEFFRTTTSINTVAVPGRAPARGRNGRRSRIDRRTPASSSTAGPTRAPVSSVQTRPARALVFSVLTRPAPEPVSSVLTRPTQTTRARRERKRAKYKPALYCSLFVIGVLISAADLFTGVWMTIRDEDDEIAEPAYFLLMGGIEAMFVVWHTCTLASIVCCRKTTYNRVIFWLLRIFHLGALLLFLLVAYVSWAAWPKFPNLFQWTWAMLCVFLSLMTKYITLIYWVVELTVDVCKHLYW